MYDRRSWGRPFVRHVSRQRYARELACVHCGRGPVHTQWLGEWTHVACLTAEEQALI